jgi:hypothetical protein
MRRSQPCSWFQLTKMRLTKFSANGLRFGSPARISNTASAFGLAFPVVDSFRAHRWFISSLRRRQEGRGEALLVSTCAIGER